MTVHFKDVLSMVPIAQWVLLQMKVEKKRKKMMKSLSMTHFLSCLIFHNLYDILCLCIQKLSYKWVGVIETCTCTHLIHPEVIIINPCWSWIDSFCPGLEKRMIRKMKDTSRKMYIWNVGTFQSSIFFPNLYFFFIPFGWQRIKNWFLKRNSFSKKRWATKTREAKKYIFSSICGPLV